VRSGWIIRLYDTARAVDGVGPKAKLQSFFEPDPFNTFKFDELVREVSGNVSAEFERKEKMSRIDTYLHNVSRLKATGLQLSSNGHVVLKFHTGDRDATKTTSHLQLTHMIEEIAPNGAMCAIGKGEKSIFAYAAPGGSYDIEVIPGDGEWVVLATPTPTAKEDAEVSRPVPSQNVDSMHSLCGSDTKTCLENVNDGTDIPVSMTASLPPIDSSPVAKDQFEVLPDQPSAKWLNGLLAQMTQAGCSDVHLTADSPPYWRLDGQIEPIEGESPLSVDFLEQQIRSISPPENQEEFDCRNDTDFAYEVPGLSRFRVNVFRDRKGVGAVLRTIPFEIPSATQLGLPPAILDLANLSKGLVLVTGPTGSGKSTTLAALIDYINETRKDHLITIEDPIEFVHPNKRCLVNQREIQRHTNSFKDALRAALREDPDIVLVGEMRDLETIEIAVETAETGHLVFGTLHTTTAPSTVDRIIDQFPSDRQEQIRQMLSSSLKGVVSQVLCRKKGGGRVAAHEILIGTSAAANLIREAKTFQLFSLMQTGKNLGMCKLEDTLMKLVSDDLVEPVEAYRKANNKQEFKGMLEREGITIEATE
jgi:twitching motility protein PilT